MATVAASAQKSNKAFRATVYDQAGTLVKVNGQVYFLTNDDVVPFEVEMAPFTCVLGEVGLAETARLLDTLHGGTAWIATHRAQEVA
jgi:hypothetical protein